MRDGLELLGDLNSRDLEWVLTQGHEEQVIANTAVIEEGETPDDLILVLSGLLDVRLSGMKDHRIATLGPGELLGELSFLEGRAASASVTAVENSQLLRLPLASLRQELERDAHFSSRLYRALAVAGARRLRAREAHFAGLLASQDDVRGERADIWTRIEPALGGLKELLQQADQAALKSGGTVPADLADQVMQGFPRFIRALNDLIGDGADIHESVREEVGARVQREILPYLLLTRTAERLYAKPRGYAGDFLSIDWMYEDVADGTGRLGPLLDRAFLDEPAAAAVRNRRGLLVREIKRHLTINPGREVHITAMACGPAREIFDVYEELDDPARLRTTLIDIDQEALTQVEREIERRGLCSHVQTHQANLVYLALGREQLELPPQDLMYSIGLIDYFNDKLVGRLVDWAHGRLRTGGELILGNFHPRNPDKALMDYVLDWRLIHRAEGDMHTLFETSRFGARCSAVHFEDAEVNLFAVGTKT